MKQIYTLLFFTLICSTTFAQNEQNTLSGEWLWTETTQHYEGVTPEMELDIQTELNKGYYGAPYGLTIEDGSIAYFIEWRNMEPEELVALKLSHNEKDKLLIFEPMEPIKGGINEMILPYLWEGGDLILVMDFTERIRERLKAEEIQKVHLHFHFQKERKK